MKNRCIEAFFLLLTVGLLLFGLAACTQVPLPHSQQEESKQGQSQTVPEPSSGLVASSSSQGGKATQAPQSSMSQTVSAGRTQAVSTTKPSASTKAPQSSMSQTVSASRTQAVSTSKPSASTKVPSVTNGGSGLAYPIKGVPGIESFSDSEDESLRIHFPPIESAQLQTEEGVRELSVEDPRLIRLVNFLDGSVFDMSLTVWRQGYVDAAAMQSIDEAKRPLLKVRFKQWEDNSGRESTSEIWVYSDCCLLMVDSNRPGYSWATQPLAEQAFPYKALFMAAKRSGAIADNVSDEGWLDLLAYAGF